MKGALSEDDPIAALLSEELRTDLRRWSNQAPSVMELLAGVRDRPGYGRPDAEGRRQIDEHFARKAALATRVQAELGPETVVSWEDSLGVEHTVVDPDSGQASPLEGGPSES